MRTRTLTTIAVTAATLLAVSSASAWTSASASTSVHAGTAKATDACTSWTLVPSPAPGFTDPAQSGSYAEFDSVSVLSSHDVWFAGLNDAGASTTGPWATRWNGHSVTAAQDVPIVAQAQSPYLSDLEPGSFDSGHDGWILAPTQVFPTFDPHAAFGYHWHGGAWSTVPMAVSTPPDRQGPEFNAVTAVSASDAWAVGAWYSTKVLFGVTAVGALIAHWNGAAWTVLPNPASSQRGVVLSAVDAVSPSDVWAVGQQGNPSQTSNTGHTPFIEHWNGSAWSIVPAPSAGKPSWLEAVSGDSATDAWAVGYQTKASTGALVPLAEHWNGTTWSTVSLPASVTGLNGLDGVYAAAPDDVWAIEGGPQYIHGGSGHNVFLHWDGTSWTTVPGPGPSEDGLGYLYTAIGGTGSGNVWAAGTVSDAYLGGQDPLISRLSCAQGGQR
jgi:hypothetical protein